MGKKSTQLTVEQVSVLLWVKALEDYRNEKHPEETLDEMIQQFDLTSIDMSDEEFMDGLDALQSIGVIDKKGEEQIYELTKSGEKLMIALSAVKGFSDETVQKIFNGTIRARDFVLEHKDEIFSIFTKIIGI